MNRQVNNPTNWGRSRPPKWRAEQSINSYLNEIELWARQVYENITGIQQLKSYKIADLPNAADFEASIIYVSDEAGGATVAFSDGADWRRVQDRAVVS